MGKREDEVPKAPEISPADFWDQLVKVNKVDPSIATHITTQIYGPPPGTEAEITQGDQARADSIAAARSDDEVDVPLNVSQAGEEEQEEDKSIERRLLESAGRGISAGFRGVGNILEKLPLPPMERRLPEGESGIEFRGGLPVIVSRGPNGQDLEFDIAENLGLITAAGAAPSAAKGVVGGIRRTGRELIRGRPKGTEVAARILSEATESSLTPTLRAADKATRVANQADDAVRQAERLAMQGKGSFADIRVAQQNATKAREAAKVAEQQVTPEAQVLVDKLLKQPRVTKALQTELTSAGGRAELRKLMPEISDKNFNSMMRLLERGKFQEWRNRILAFGVAYPLARWLIVNPIVSALGVREGSSR